MGSNWILINEIKFTNRQVLWMRRWQRFYRRRITWGRYWEWGRASGLCVEWVSCNAFHKSECLKQGHTANNSVLNKLRGGKQEFRWLERLKLRRHIPTESYRVHCSTPLLLLLPPPPPKVSWVRVVIKVCFEGTLSRTFFGFFSEMAPKSRLSTFNHAGNAPRT